MAKFIHDCSECTYIETTKDGYDIYIHIGGRVNTTVIERYGNEGSEYKSYPLCLLLEIKEKYFATLPRVTSLPM